MSTRRESLLREMGLAPIWKLRARSDDAQDVVCDVVDEVPMAQAATAAAPATGVEKGEPIRDATPVASPVGAPGVQGAALSAGAPDLEVRRARIATMDWEALEADIASCTACRLCEQRRQTVPGMGDRAAEWMLVGEGPGAEEDRRGLPFVGPAGKLLDAMLAAVELQRETGVYIANTVKCRPPHNRTPEADEIAACRPYLERQIELVQPRLLIALGRPAAQTLLASDVRIAAARGKLFGFGSIPLVVTYHPAYLLRNQHDKAKAWEDLCFARRTVRL